MLALPSSLSGIVLACGIALASCARPERSPPSETAPALPLETIASAADAAPRELAIAPPPSANARLKYGLALRAERAGFALYSDLALPSERYVEIAEATSRRTRAWLGIAGEPQPLDLVLSDAPGELRAPHELLGLPPSPATAPSGEPSAEGYFPKSRLILLLAAPGRNLEWFVSHEVCHAVFREATRSHPVVLNEGLAELLPSWILYVGDAAAPELVRATYAEYEAVLAKLDPERDVPSLESFVGLTWRNFHADRWRNFALAWSLAKLLVESEAPELRGRFLPLAQALGTHAQPWDDFREIYDAEHVERAWHASIAQYARAK